MSLLARFFDERFLMHRLRSSSTAGIAGGILAVLLFAWHYYVDHRWSWDLFAVAVTVVTIKSALMLYYRFTD